MMRVDAWPALLCVLALVGAPSTVPAQVRGSVVSTRPVSAQSVARWLTQSAGPASLTRQADLPLAVLAPQPIHIAVDTNERYQEMVGFGAAMTDSSAFILRHRMNATERDALMRDLFDRKAGIGLGFMRLTIGASDFSLTHYSFDDMPAGQEDLELKRFSIAANHGAVLPLVQQALAINPQLKVMASPWSAPGWMKTSGSLIKGRLRPDRRAVFAEYLSRYVQAYEAAGVPMFALTLQNEPHFEPKDYPGMRLNTEDRRSLIAEHVGPMFATRHPATRILEWDHNWNEPEEPLGVLADPQARQYVDGVAWHCYRGRLTAQTTVHRAYPDQETYLTECSGGGWEHRDADPLTDAVRVLLVGSTRGWAKGVLLWNLALDEKSGPHLGGCPNCRGVVTVDSETGAVTRNPEYFALAHFSRFVRPGAERIGSSDGAHGLDNVAFQNRDDRSVVLVVVNSATKAQHFSAGDASCAFVDTLPPRSVGTYVWAASSRCS